MVVVTKSCWQQSLFICQLTNTDNCGRTTLRATIPENGGSSAYFGIYLLGRYTSFASNN